MAKHVVLVGLPGAGKTTVGRAVAPLLERPFVDLDEVIERQTGERVRDIFATRGEAVFRGLEREATRALVGAEPSVVSPGGGWIMHPETVALIRPVGCIIYLKTTPNTVLARLGEGYRARPLLEHDPRAALTRLFEDRRRAYETADEVVDVEALTLLEVTAAVAELARRTHIR